MFIILFYRQKATFLWLTKQRAVGDAINYLRNFQNVCDKSMLCLVLVVQFFNFTTSNFRAQIHTGRMYPDCIASTRGFIRR